MNKIELIKATAKKTDFDKNICETIIDEMLNVIIETLASGESINIFKFGSFEVKDREARIARNPKTGESVNVPARKSVSFKASNGFKNAVNNK